MLIHRSKLFKTDKPKQFSKCFEIIIFVKWVQKTNPIWDVIDALWNKYPNDLYTIMLKYDNNEYIYVETENDESDLARNIISNFFNGEPPNYFKMDYFNCDLAFQVLERKGYKENEIMALVHEMRTRPDLFEDKENVFFDYGSFGHDFCRKEGFVFYRKGWVILN